MGKVFGQDETPRGVGNQVSAEFNLVYRWYSCISERDDKWTQQSFREKFGKESHEVSMEELLSSLSKWEKGLSKDLHQRPFAKLERQSNGTYKDDDLVNIVADSVEDLSGKCYVADASRGFVLCFSWTEGPFPSKANEGFGAW